MFQHAPASGASPNPRLVGIPPNTALSLGEYAPAALAGCAANSAKIIDYSRLTYDPVHHQVLMFGGGHATTPRTDVDVFSFETLRWHSAYPSTPAAEMTVANFDRETGAWASSGHPVARHTYDMLTFAPNARELVLLIPTGPVALCTERFAYPQHPGRIWHYDPQTGRWTPGPASHPWRSSVAPASEYDPVSGKIIVLSLYGLYTYDPIARVASLEQKFGRTGLSYAQNLVYFPPNQRMYYIQNNGTVFEVTLDRNNFANSAVVELTGIEGMAPQGDMPQVSALGETGWAYSSRAKIIGGGIANGIFYALDPVEKKWSARVMNTLPANVPVGKTAYHALDYDPVDDVYVFIGQTTRGPSAYTFTTWAYRFGPGPAPDPAQRAAAASHGAPGRAQ